MPLICPGCGGRLDVQAERGLVPFSCPYCAAPLTPEKNGQAVVLKAAPGSAPAPAPAPAGAAEDVPALLRLAKAENDPVKRYALLKRAEEAAPYDLAVKTALLLHGRLHQRDRRKLDYSVIKCYLLNMFEEPEAHPAPRREAMARELFHEDLLTGAMAMAPDPVAFLKNYLTLLSREYIGLFLRGSSRHMKAMFGFSLGGKPEKLLAPPAAAMISRMLAEPLLSAQEQALLSRAFYDAFSLEFEGETGYLDGALGPLKDLLEN